MSRKAKDISVAILRWVLKEWVKALLGTVAVIVLGYLGLVYRTYLKNWLVAQHNLEMYGWVWIGLFLLILILSVFAFWLITRTPKRDIYTDEEDIKNILELWFRRFSTNDRGIHKDILTVKFSLCDQLNNLKKGSSEEFLPEIVEKSGIYEIKSKGRKTIVIVRKGFTIKVGPYGPY